MLLRHHPEHPWTIVVDGGTDALGARGAAAGGRAEMSVPNRATLRDLRALFEPKSVAVI